MVNRGTLVELNLGPSTFRFYQHPRESYTTRTPSHYKNAPHQLLDWFPRRRRWHQPQSLFCGSVKYDLDSIQTTMTWRPSDVKKDDAVTLTEVKDVSLYPRMQLTPPSHQKWQSFDHAIGNVMETYCGSDSCPMFHIPPRAAAVVVSSEMRLPNATTGIWKVQTPQFSKHDHWKIL